MPLQGPITSIKGFNSDFTCRGFQFSEGETYTHAGTVKACKGGFHACTTDAHPLSVFDYYAPAGSRFHEVVQSGSLDSDDGIKISASVIMIGVEIPLGSLIKRAVDWVFAKAAPENTERATGDRGAASATGYQGAASATGYQGAASATGYRGAASATGYQGAAMASGPEGKVKGADGNALFAVERDDNYNIVSVAAGIVGKKKIKADTWYMCRAGKLVEA